MQVVKAFTKEELQSAPKVCGAGTLSIAGQPPVTPDTSDKYTVQAGVRLTSSLRYLQFEHSNLNFELLNF